MGFCEGFTVLSPCSTISQKSKPPSCATKINLQSSSDPMVKETRASAAQHLLSPDDEAHSRNRTLANPPRTNLLERKGHGLPVKRSPTSSDTKVRPKLVISPPLTLAVLDILTPINPTSARSQ